MLFIILFLNPEYVFRFRHIQYTRTKLDCLSCTTKKYTSGGYGYLVTFVTFFTILTNLDKCIFIVEKLKVERSWELRSL